MRYRRDFVRLPTSAERATVGSLKISFNAILQSRSVAGSTLSNLSLAEYSEC